MAILPIIETPDPRLRVISKPVETFDAELKQLVADMFETMYDAPGIGLAAIQVGVPKRILVIDLQEPDPEDEEGKKVIRDPRVFINPVFSDESEEHSVYSEGLPVGPRTICRCDAPRRGHRRLAGRGRQASSGTHDRPDGDVHPARA